MNKHTNPSLKPLVGARTYNVWVEMLRVLVPESRTHRLAPVVAGMLQFAAGVASEKFGDEPKEGSLAELLLNEERPEEPRGSDSELGRYIATLFSDAGVKHDRVSVRGDRYSIIDSAICEFANWYNMPWE